MRRTEQTKPTDIRVAIATLALEGTEEAIENIRKLVVAAATRGKGG